MMASFGSSNRETFDHAGEKEKDVHIRSLCYNHSFLWHRNLPVPRLGTFQPSGLQVLSSDLVLNSTLAIEACSDD